MAQFPSHAEPRHAGLITREKHHTMKCLIQLISCGIVTFAVATAEPAPAPLSAKDLAAKLSALQQDGPSWARMKMVVKSTAETKKTSLQLQIKQRRTLTSTEVVYQVLWPKERAGEAVLLRQSGNKPASGFLFTPPNTVRTLDASHMKEALFGSDLSYADVLENFFAWENQTIVGTEVVDRVQCQILESKPSNKQDSSYFSVRTWVDSRRNIPLRIEKFLPADVLIRRFVTTKVATDDIRRSIPANLTVSSPQTGSSTDLDGSKLKHDVVLTDRDFTVEAIKETTTPRPHGEEPHSKRLPPVPTPSPTMKRDLSFPVGCSTLRSG